MRTERRNAPRGMKGAIWCLAGVLAMVVGAGARAETLKLGGTGSGLGTVKRLADEYRKVDPAFRLEIVPNLGSGGGLKALSRDALQMAVVSRPLKPEEAAGGLQPFEYGRTPFVLATSRKPAETASMAKLADYYAGRTAAWPDGTPVRVVLRPPSDGDSMFLAGFSPAMKEALDLAMRRAGMVVANTDQDSADEIERLPGSLGTSSLALILAEKRTLFVLPIDGVVPSVRTLADGSYRYFKPMLLVTKGAPAGSAARFIDFVRSAQGQKVLAETGHWVPGAASVGKPPVH